MTDSEIQSLMDTIDQIRTPPRIIGRLKDGVNQLACELATAKRELSMGYVVCRGSWTLGSACGSCRRCVLALIHLIDELTDEDYCRYDHNGLCQSHSLHDRPCPHETAKHTMTTAKRLGIDVEGYRP